ncbi:hypothetical protein HanLR1_Chr12g0430241 [Helianthus annuus]|nr:hypothetical protein HanLR1_Chr12g0430241 [Helianthus annuus]
MQQLLSENSSPSSLPIGNIPLAVDMPCARAANLLWCTHWLLCRGYFYFIASVVLNGHIIITYTPYMDVYHPIPSHRHLYTRLALRGWGRRRLMARSLHGPKTF